MKNIKYLLMGACACLLCACSDDPTPNPGPTPDPEPDRSVFAVGADVSWVTQQEKEGIKFYDADGVDTECMALLKANGVNSIRLRVWVNPSDPAVSTETGGWCDMYDMLVKAKRAQKLGMRVMVDFHYSDSWADPAQQRTPAAWADYGIDELTKALSDHTTKALQLLADNGVEVEWVQVGNETRGGMCYPLGEYANNANFTALVNAGYDATKAIYPDAKVIIHIDSGDNLSLYTRIFSVLTNCNGKYDVIGMSLYPINTYYDTESSYFKTSQWKDKADKCIANIQTLINTYGKEVIVCETGMPSEYTTETLAEGQTMEERCESDAYEYMSYILPKLKAITGCKGMFYWEPQCYNWNGYALGAFKADGKPNKMFEALTLDKE